MAVKWEIDRVVELDCMMADGRDLILVARKDSLAVVSRAVSRAIWMVSDEVVLMVVKSADALDVQSVETMDLKD